MCLVLGSFGPFLFVAFEILVKKFLFCLFWNLLYCLTL